MSYSARELLARIIKCEAGGEGDNGMRAVATVIMNRVNASTGEYQRVGQGDLRQIIYQTGQFDCVRDVVGGRPNMQTIYNSNPEPIHYEIADWALGGGLLNAAGTSLWYFNPYGECREYFPPNRSGAFHTRINLHCFYRPTELYHQT
ncbi:cell wall hydrolase [Oscillospiraceae bacterium MB08-C2-2]|nr:cell wall hydrolase [Oscillospiraceae bacterium MB08-C2-2]